MSQWGQMVRISGKEERFWKTESHNSEKKIGLENQSLQPRQTLGYLPVHRRLGGSS
jgi:hypothetical protein